jgi:hypothetical protein
MAKAKSKNPMGRPRFEVTPEVLARSQKRWQWTQGLTDRPDALAQLGYFSHQLSQLRSGREFGVFGEL